MTKIGDLLKNYKKEDLQKNKCPEEITFEMLEEFLGKANTSDTSRDALWRSIYHVMYELDDFGFAYASEYERKLFSFNK